MSILVENAIAAWHKKAERTGEMSQNKFRGKEMNYDEYFRTPPEHRLGMKILKDANCLPPAVELMKQLEEKKKELSCIEAEHQQSKLRKEIRDLELKKNIFLGKL